MQGLLGTTVLASPAVNPSLAMECISCFFFFPIIIKLLYELVAALPHGSVWDITHHIQISGVGKVMTFVCMYFVCMTFPTPHLALERADHRKTA